MPMKDWMRKFVPMQLYIILFLTIAFFITELVVAHLTHALTLLMDSYHTLCNIIALSGCIITVKYVKNKKSIRDEVKEEKTTQTTDLQIDDKETCKDNKEYATSHTTKHQENKLKNTFGWTRIDVIVMLICCVFLASLSFSLVVEAAQTLVHIDHFHEMHHPVTVFCVGAVGLLLNGICYLLIGGYTFHQGSFLYVTESGDVVLDKVVTSESVRKGERRLSRTRTIPPTQYRQRQGLWEMSRDVIGCIFVEICALIVYFTNEDVAKFIDPVLSIFSSVILLILSFPYMRESCLILLQTIPGKINIDSLKSQLTEQFPDIINVHDFHVWELAANKVISTVHIIFQNPKVFAKITKDINDFLIERGITQVTIQPEFFTKSISTESLVSEKNPFCLMKCNGENCIQNHCCPNIQDDTETLKEITKWKSLSMELVNKSSNLEIHEGEQSAQEGLTYDDNKRNCKLVVQKSVSSPEIQKECD